MLFFIIFISLSNSNIAFAQTAVYTISSTAAVTTSGTAPSGSSATYSQTFATAEQITSGNSATLTLSGYAGYKITSIVLNMKSNASAGSGTLSVVAGSTSIASVSPTAAFNTASWNGAYSPTFVNITKTPTAYSIGIGENVVISIAATANSLYIHSYSITYAAVSSAKTSTTTGGPWATGSTWIGGVAPTSAENVIIDGPVTTGAVTRNSGTTTTINTGASLAVSGTFDNTGATTTVNGTFQLESGGYATGNNFVYGSTGSLNFNTSYGVDNTHVYWPTSNGPYNVSVLTGTLTLNSGANRTIAGTFQTSGGVVFPSATLTLNGTAKINASGFFSNSPIYGSSSILIYNTGSAFSRGNEWTTATSSTGYPNNVQISNPGTNTTLNMGSTVAQCAGSITVDVSAILNTTSNVLTVLGSVTSNGTISLNGDVKVSGNWTIGSSGTQTNNSKAVFFNGPSGNQTITKTGAGTIFFDYLIINKAAGNVVLNNSPATDIIINTTSGDVLQLLGSGQLDLNGREIKLQNTNGNIKTTGAQTITSSIANAKLSISGTKFITGGTLSINSNVDTYLTAAVDFGSNVTTINGLLQINGGGSVINNAPVYSSTALLKYNSGGIFGRTLEWSADAATATFPSSGYPNNVQISNNTTLDLGANSGSGIAKSTNGYLTIDDGSKLDLAGSSAMTKPLTIKGDFTMGLSGTSTIALSNNSGADLYLAGDIYFNGTYAFFPNNRAVFFTKNGTQKINASSTPTIPYIVFQPTSGSTIVQLNGTDLNITAPSGGNVISFSSSSDVFDLNGRTLTLGTSSTSNTISGSGTFKGSTTSNLTLLGNGSIGTLNFTSGSQTLGTFTMNRQGSVIGATLGTTLTVNTALALTNGIIDLGANNMILGASATVTGTPSASTFVIAENGELRKTFTANGSFTFPVGDNTGGLDYSPATLNFTSGSYSSAYIGVKITDAKHPNNGAATNYITRYWSVSSSGITSPNYNFSGTYTSGDINGTETLSDSGRWDGTNWTVGSTLTSNTLSITGLTSLPSTNQFTGGNPLAPAEINITGNSVSIVSGDTTPSTTDFTDFGSAVIGGTIAKTFTIQNIGAATLNLTSSPIVILSGAGVSAFSVTTQPSGTTIAPSASRTFIITYTASALTAQNATVTIANDDSDENPYTFTITGVGTPSVASDIIANAAYLSSGYNSNIAYATYQSATISNTGSSTGGSIDLFKFDIRDGGVTADTDALPTILSGITFNVTNTSMIRSAALFSGNTLVNPSPTINTGTGTITFSGLSGANVTAADGTSNSLTLRVTFLSTVTDNTQFQVTISNANVTGAGSSTSSLFTTFTSVVSSTTSDRNRIEVTADRLAFVQQPTTTSATTAMTPAVTVAANDGNGNRDLDFFTAVSITSTGTLTGTPVSGSVSSGLATFSTLTHTVAGTGLILTATTTGLTTNTVDSSSFIIVAITYVNGDWMSRSDGTWDNKGTGTALWKKRVSGAWVDQSASNDPSGTADTYTVYIANNVSIPTSTTQLATAKLFIMDGGFLDFTSSSLWTFRNIYIDNNGSLQATTRFTTLSSGNFEINDGGNFYFNYPSNAMSTSSVTSSILAGIEIFHPDSNFIVKAHDTGSGNYFLPASSSLSSNTYNGVTAYFGNLKFLTGDVRLTTTELSSTTTYLTHGNLEFTTSTNFTLLYGNGTWIVGKNLVLNSGSTGSINVTTGSNTINLNIKGNFINNSDKNFTLINATSGSTTLNIDGNVTLAGANTLSLSATNGGVATVNLKGSLAIASGATLSSLSTTAGGATFNFSGTYNSTTPATIQTIDIASTSSTRNQYIDFNVNSGAYVQLINRNLELGINSTFTVKGSGSTGGILDFNFSGTTPLNLTSYSTGSKFTSQQASTLKISNTAGISASSGTSGNVQVTNAPTYNSVATYHYIGKANQATGSGLPTGSSAKIVIVELIDNTKTLTLTNSVGISNTATLDALGGKLEIRKGIVLGTSAADFTGSGRLVMSDGEYQISAITATPISNYLPQLSNYGNYSLTGGTINLSGNNAIQILSGTPTYYNFTTSGANTLGTDYKGISSAASITNTIKVSETSILDIKTSSLGGSGTNLTMTETGRYITAGSGTQPDATGTYNLGATTTIEFNGSSTTDIRLSPTYGKIIVSGTNVSNTSATTGIKFQSSGAFTVNSGATFKLANTSGFAGSTSTSIDNTNTPTITLATGSTIDYNGASQSITATPSYSKLKISGTATKTIPGTTEVLVGDNLTVSASTLQIDSNKLLTVTNGITNSSGNDIIIKDSGNLVQITDGISDTGTIKMTRTSRSMLVNDYVYWGSPIQEDLLSPIQLPLNVYNAIYMWNLNPAGAATGTWTAPTATVAGRGFITRVSSTGTGSKDFDFKGTPNNGVVTYNVTPYDASSMVSGNTALLANPYPSAINAATFIAGNPKVGNTGLGGTLYFWTASTPFTNGAYLTTDYATWNGTGSTATSPGASSMSPTGKIAAGQGFFAQVFADTPTTTNFNVTFNNSMRVRTTSDNSQFFRTTENEINRIWLNLTKPDSSIFRQMLVGYITDATNDLDRLFDGNSFTNNEVDFYSLVTNNTLVIQGRALPFQDSDLVPLGYKATNPGAYTISIDHVDGLFENGQDIYLEDKLLDIIYDIKAAPYNFNTDAGSFNDRFVLRYNNTALSTSSFQINNSVIVAKDKQQLIIKSQLEFISKVSIYDIFGRKVFEKEAINANSFNASDIVLNQQTLIVKVTLANGQIVTKKIIY